jgi:hypothetical protein
MNYYARGHKAIKLRTVNVLEFCNNQFQQSFSFVDNPEGNKMAERKFARLVREHNPKAEDAIQYTHEDIDAMLDDGVYDDECGYQVLITHSL